MEKQHHGNSTANEEETRDSAWVEHADVKTSVKETPLPFHSLAIDGNAEVPL